MRHRPTTSTQAVAVSLSAAVLLVVVVLLTSAATRRFHTRIDMGSAPAWLSALFSLIAVGGVAVAVLTYRRAVRNREDDEIAPARLLVVTRRGGSAYAHGPGDNYATTRIVLRNASTSDAFSDIQILGVAHGPYGCQQTIRDYFKDAAEARFELLGPGDFVTSGWVVPVPNLGLDSLPPVSVLYEYSDRHGRRWRRFNNYEPEQISTPPLNAASLQQFHAALASRPGQRDTVSISIDNNVKSAFPEDVAQFSQHNDGSD